MILEGELFRRILAEDLAAPTTTDTSKTAAPQHYETALRDDEAAMLRLLRLSGPESPPAVHGEATKKGYEPKSFQLLVSPACTHSLL